MTDSPYTDMVCAELARINDMDRLREMAKLALSMMEYDLTQAREKLADVQEKYQHNLGLMKAMEIVVKRLS